MCGRLAAGSLTTAIFARSTRWCGWAMMHRSLLTARRMTVDHVYRVTEIVGSSRESADRAIRNGVERAAQTLHNLDWFQVTEVRGTIDEGSGDWYQVTLK